MKQWMNGSAAIYEDRLSKVALWEMWGGGMDDNTTRDGWMGGNLVWFLGWSGRDAIVENIDYLNEYCQSSSTHQALGKSIEYTSE